MFNALLAFGDCFLEIVSPVDKGYEQNSTSAKLLRKMDGDCGYVSGTRLSSSPQVFRGHCATMYAPAPAYC
jgi:hypothetical protein